MGSFPSTYNDPCSEGRYLSSWSINFVAINKDLGKKNITVVLKIKMKIFTVSP